MLILFMVIAVILIASQAQAYTRYMTLNHLKYPDTFGSFGGFIFGMLVGMFLLHRGNSRQSQSVERYEKNVKIFGGVTSAILFLLLIVVFFFSYYKPKQYDSWTSVLVSDDEDAI